MPLGGRPTSRVERTCAPDDAPPVPVCAAMDSQSRGRWYQHLALAPRRERPRQGDDKCASHARTPSALTQVSRLQQRSGKRSDI